MKRTSSRIASRSETSPTPPSVVKSAKRKAEERNTVGKNGDTTVASKKAWTCKEKEQLIAGEVYNVIHLKQKPYL